jgi:hypothetical protein
VTQIDITFACLPFVLYTQPLIQFYYKDFF